jgi:hypothetical protein
MYIREADAFLNSSHRLIIMIRRHARLMQQPVFDRQPVHAEEFTRIVCGGNQHCVERVARDEYFERPDTTSSGQVRVFRGRRPRNREK